jgi:hypothetical protein
MQSRVNAIINQKFPELRAEFAGDYCLLVTGTARAMKPFFDRCIAASEYYCRWVDEKTVGVFFERR